MKAYPGAIARLLAPLAAIALGATIVFATAAPQKKLIEFGWDQPDPAFMRRHLAQMEATPFDGCVYHMVCNRVPGQRPARFTEEAWGTRAFTAAELDSGINDLVATPFKRFRWNFLRLNAQPGIDWFDDFSAVLSNVRLAAEIAKRGGSAGVMFDTEPYEKQIFRYDAQRDTAKHSFEEYAAQARKRGAEVMRAFEQGYPGLTVFTTVGVSWLYLEEMGGIHRRTSRFALLVPFMDGMFSAASDSSRIVDGCEGSYPVRSASQVDAYIRIQTTGVSPWYTDSTRYHRIVSRSIGLWLDHNSEHLGWNVQDPKQNYRPPDSLLVVVRRALTLSDEYVWLYSQKPRWWSADSTRKNLPDDYVRAVREARKGLTP